MNNNNYAKHLFDKTTDGYIHLMKIDNKNIKIYNTENKALKEVIEEYVGEENIYIAPNTFFIPKRRVNNIRQFRAFYIDIDGIEGDKHYVAYKIFELAEDGVIPKPSMIVDSGRGIHCYWRIKNAPYGAIQTWQELEDMLFYRLESLGADRRATDGARVLRLPGSINSRNNEECRVMYVDDSIEYSMVDLRETYLSNKYKSKISAAIKQNKEFINNNRVIKNSFFNSYSLHMTRAEDIEVLCSLRGYRVKGHRNMIIHCYAYWLGIYERNIEVLKDRVKELNNKFIVPLKNSEIEAIIRSVDKAIDKFIEYEQGIREGQDKRVTKGMRDKGGYWYKNSTLIELLNITEEEQRKLKTIIGIRVKYDRNNIKRTPRNENGLTKKQQELQDEKNKIKELRLQGLSMNKIAIKLNISKAKVVKLANL